MQDTIGELWIQTHITTSFWYYILWVHTLLTRKLQVVYVYMDVLHIEWLLYYWKCLFSVLELDARYNWQVMAPNMHHNPFAISHLYVITHITWKLQVTHDCSTIRDIPCVVWSCIIDPTGELQAPDTHWCSLIQHCPVYMLYCKGALLPMMCCFIRTDLASCTTYMYFIVFSINRVH